MQKHGVFPKLYGIAGVLSYLIYCCFFTNHEHSLPEVIDIKENEDGTITLTVEAVCDMVICDDAVITHELTVRFAEDGSFQYLGNEILNDGIMQIPDYQYRIKN